MAPESFLSLGRVVKTHGLGGEVSVASGLDDRLEALCGVQVWFVPPPAGVRAGTISSVRPGPKGPLVKIDTVGNIDTARALVGTVMLARSCDVPEALLQSQDTGDDPVGLAVTDAAHGFLGEVTEVILTGANDVWVIHGPLGEVLLPVIDDVVLSVDYAARTASVKLLFGLLPGEDA